MSGETMFAATSVDYPDSNNTPPESGGEDGDVDRSVRNVRVWMSYLPQDCIATMIRMGWDFST